MGNPITVPDQVRASFTNIGPAYYLGHPAHLWITVMRPQTTSRPDPTPGPSRARGPA